MTDFMGGFSSTPLSEQLKPPTNTPFSEKIPFRITKNARLADIATVPFYANASFGDYSTDIELGLDTVPLANVWLLGVIDSDGTILGNGGGEVPGSFNSSSSIVNGMQVFSGALSSYTVNKDTLTIGITSTNVGWSTLVTAYYYYAVYYDETGVASLGL